MSRWNRTHETLQRAALHLFQHHGYDATSTAQVAAAAGVSEVTLFRHFPTKASLLLDDPFDPLIADAVRHRPASETPLRATVEGVRAAWRTLDPELTDALRTRLRLVATTPSLHGALQTSGAPTIAALADALHARGATPAQAQVVSAAVVAGLGAALLEWARSGTEPLDTAVGHALDAMAGR
ncbi:TetR/AcrR family transcriptional regulator [Cellulomonas iranensis]|uniref:AcrR family transcriptional regulator n=1 Tax=Cellulomonas iranensis TaxID=76862 RepID=A0ABU0GJU4_9CELL|nr:TetR/AcrR family transcriptional regulator [Cellulomonas iranensis]MDQ0425639.1 AcrR family transcriptional regulator [Cellulomonas iranensis]